MIFEPSCLRLIQALEERNLNKPLKLGRLCEVQVDCLNAIRARKGWPTRAERLITVSPSYIQHMLKRIDVDGLTADEVGAIARHALDDASTLQLGANGRAILIYHETVEIDGNSFVPHAVLIDGEGWPNVRLYGLIPKGWAGRKKKNAPS